MRRQEERPEEQQEERPEAVGAEVPRERSEAAAVASSEDFAGPSYLPVEFQQAAAAAAACSFRSAAAS